MVRRETVSSVQEQYAFSQRRACRLLNLNRSTARYRPRKNAQTALRKRLRELAEQRPRFGYRRLTILLRREGQNVNHKRVYRLYQQEGLAVRRRTRKRVASVQRPLVAAPEQVGQEWSIDFTHDTLASGRSFRTLNVVDSYSRECLAIEVDTSLPAARVIRVLERVAAEHGLPKRLRLDNGPEFAGQMLDAWAYKQEVQLMFIQPGKPMQNGYVESFNGKFRDECLNQHWFIDLDDARELIETWREDYNTVRPHSALDYQAPVVYRQLTQVAQGTLISAG